MSVYTKDEKKLMRISEITLVLGLVFFCFAAGLHNWQAFAVGFALWIVCGVVIVVVAYSASLREAKERLAEIDAEDQKKRDNRDVARFIEAMTSRSKEISEKLKQEKQS